jgi:hypothetical protein
VRFTLSVGDVVELAYRAEERVRAGELITVSGWRVAVESVVEVRTECLDWLLILGRRHLEHVLRTYTTHYNTERPHRALALVPPEAGNTAARPLTRRSNATICLAASSTSTEPQREPSFETPQASVSFDPDRPNLAVITVKRTSQVS